MKKIILIILASLMFCNIGFAEIRLIEQRRIDVTQYFQYTLSTWCIDGYKFVANRETSDEALSMIQAFEERDGKSLPTKC